MTKRLFMISTAVMVTALGLLLLWQFRLIVVYVLFSLALAAAVRPLVRRLSERGRLARLGLILLYLLILGGFSLLLALSVTAAAGEIQLLGSQLAVQDAWQQPQWLEGTAFQELLDERLPAPSALFGAAAGDEGQLVLPTVLGFTQGLLGVISAALVILFLSIYWSIDQNHFERLWLSLVPAGRRAQVRGIWRTVEPEIGAYIRNEAIESILAGVLLGLGYWVLGLPYPILLALAAAVVLLIPMVGSFLAVLAAALVGLLTSVQFSLLSGLYTIAVLVALKRWVEPRLFKRSHYNPILTIVILLAMADAFGFLGIIVAPPLSATLQILWGSLVSHRIAAAPADRIADLKERQARVKDTVQGMEELPPLVTSGLERLATLLEQAEPVLKSASASG